MANSYAILPAHILRQALDKAEFKRDAIERASELVSKDRIPRVVVLLACEVSPSRMAKVEVKRASSVS